jgi:tyrosinase
MAVRTRRSVWSLPQGDPVITWYRKAVETMQARPQTDPTSWNYMAFVHGLPPRQPLLPAARGFWDQCQHQSWFFVSWHRGYVAAFEAIVAKTIADLQGPQDWALPYWDYSESLRTNPNARLMPPDFFEATVNGTRNALWSRRANVANGDFGLDDDVVSLDALTRFKNFANKPGPRPSGFGGPKTGFHTSGGPNGGLENVPHNAVHGQIGGFMGSPQTAALDPIFWLHHCNIDRLWEVWRNQGPAFRNPTTADWLTDVTFNMHNGTGAPFTYVSADMLDTTKVLHGYQYDKVPVAREPALEALEVAMAAEPEDRGAPELAGASQGPVSLEGDVTHVEVPLTGTRSRSFLESTVPTPQHVYLSLENITGTGAPGNYKVYLEMPGAGEPALAGILTTFGLDRASDPNREHGGSGLNHVFDITALAPKIGLTDGTVSQLKLRFVRTGRTPTTESAPPGLESFVQPEQPPSIKVGGVKLFYD